MRKNTSRDAYEDVEESIDTVSMGAVELSEFIENKLDNKPRGRTSSIFKKEVNSLIDEYNRRYGKTYSRIT